MQQCRAVTSWLNLFLGLLLPLFALERMAAGACRPPQLLELQAYQQQWQRRPPPQPQPQQSHGAAGGTAGSGRQQRDDAAARGVPEAAPPAEGLHRQEQRVAQRGGPGEGGGAAWGRGPGLAQLALLSCLGWLASEALAAW